MIFKKIVNFFIALRAKASTPVWRGEKTNYPITFAFTFEGKHYFCFENTFSTPYQRAFTAMAFYEEFRMRITREFLEVWLETMKESIDQLSISQITKLTDVLKDRLDWVVEPLTALKLASVMYFTEEESPYCYDPVYNAKKIHNWQKSDKILSFFLQMPLSDLASYLKQSQGNLQQLLDGSTAKAELQLSILREMLLRKNSNPELLKNIDLQISDLRELRSNISQFMST
mgnify:CR=1 FL=1